MSEQPTFSLAVVRGQSAGHTLRSARKRISVGSARDNDLVLVDPGVAPRHFLVLIDGPRWRVHSLTGDDVEVDRRWAHPINGKRGAIIRTSSTEIVLFPGHLDKQTVDAEIARRANVEDATEMATSINLPKLALDDAEEHTNPVRAVTQDPRSDPDLVEMAAMPTIAGERPPDALREAAAAMLEQRRASTNARDPRAPVAPSVLRENSGPNTPRDPLANAPVQGNLHGGPSSADERTVGVSWSQIEPPPSRRGASKWDKARRKPPGPTPRQTAIPEVLATPESQIMPVPGSSRSVVSERPRFDDGPDAEVIPIGGEREPRRSNAWDDRAAAPATPSGRNAWGDASSRALVPTRSEAERRNAWGEPKSSGGRKRNRGGWGDESARGARPDPGPKTPPPSDPHRRPVVQTDQVAHMLQLSSLAGHDEPALEIITHPDGKYATQARLLGARIEDFAKNLGYRAYMVSSPDPLSGKTTAVCNLAFALAEDTHRRIALVEANFRYPRFAEIFGLDERQGLISVLEGRNRLHEVGVKLSDRNLLILPAGGRHTAPAEVLASPRFKSLVAELVDTVDIALIDAPAVNAFADANLILPLVDAAFLVVSEGQTRRSALGKALGQLGPSRVLGSLFNQIPKKVQKRLDKERKERHRAKS